MSHIDSVILGGGCFWCLDALYRRIRGVVNVTSGYAGGESENPTYEQVCTGFTNHAEVVKVEFQTDEISLETILEIFWALHDPTTKNQQGNDVGTQYRSAIYYNSDEQKKAIEESIETTAKKLWSKPITTEVAPLKTFWPAEDYHQDYFNKNPEHGYCQIIINPKVAKLKQKFTDLISL